MWQPEAVHLRQLALQGWPRAGVCKHGIWEEFPHLSKTLKSAVCVHTVVSTVSLMEAVWNFDVLWWRAPV